MPVDEGSGMFSLSAIEDREGATDRATVVPPDDTRLYDGEGVVED